MFEDFGLPDAKLLLAKADLIVSITEAVRRHGYTPAEAASVLGITPERYRLLCKRPTGRITIDMLVKYLEKLGYDVEITAFPVSDVKPKAKRAKPVRKITR